MRYGEAIEADLALRGWDLAVLWRARRVRFLLNVVDHLPRDSHYIAALADDDEMAERMPEPEASARPPLSDYSPTVERLDLIADRLGEVVAAVYNTVAKRPQKPPKAQPRPETARDRLRRSRRRAKYDLVKSRLASASTAGRPTMADSQASGPQHSAPKPGR